MSECDGTGAMSLDRVPRPWRLAARRSAAAWIREAVFRSDFRTRDCPVQCAMYEGDAPGATRLPVDRAESSAETSASSVTGTFLRTPIRAQRAYRSRGRGISNGLRVARQFSSP